MNLIEIRSLLRRDLHDEDDSAYRWTDDELDRCIELALQEMAEALPLETVSVLATTAGSREIDLSALTRRITVQALEYPLNLNPPAFQPFSIWGNTLTVRGEVIPNGANCRVYYGKLHTLDLSGSSLPAQYEALLAAGAGGLAASVLAVNSINRINTGGAETVEQWQICGRDKLAFFRSELKRLGRRSRLRVSVLYSR